jgi:hypothetical protein
MCILEATCDNLVKATEYFDCDISIRTAAGDPAVKPDWLKLRAAFITHMAALLAYKTCLKTVLTNTPVHPITASADYRLGCVEYELKNNEVAM